MGASGFFIPPGLSATPNPKSVYQFSTTRFTLLTPRLIRIEISLAGSFEDRPSQVFWHRNLPLPHSTVTLHEQALSIDTEFFQLDYKDSPKPLKHKSFKIIIKETGAIIDLDSPNPGQLPGTARTLDETNGSIRLQPGLISRSGWTLLNDTSSLVFNADGWLEPRPNQPGYQDLYLLVCGHDYKAALKDYQLVTGAAPLLPRAFLGNWWSRYWEYSEEDIQHLVNRFQAEQIPLSVFIIDMDWHITKTGNSCSGWTGFSWNKALFPDPPALLKWLHNHGLITSLNLHPAEGIHPHEDQYDQAALKLGLDPADAQPIPFDIANPEFVQVYFEQMLHPLEGQGVDFWWIDWQQGFQTTLPSLDPLWWLNHLHFYDLARADKKRPIVFSRWGGPGNHRYPIGFSGDTIISWETLAYQPYFTAAAANVAYGWWSHDIGGHMYGMEDGELFTRWVQFGVLSPILRLHSCKNQFVDHSPWKFGAEILRLTRQAMQLRHALLPYLYTMAQRNEKDCLPLITPLYYDWAEEEAAYTTTGQYLFGSELMAAPITTPLDHDLNLCRQVIWFPPGEWFDFFTGEPFSGPQQKILYYGLDQIPLFARAGAIVPLQTDTINNGCANPKAIDLLVFPGQDGTFTLYEDDGISQEYRQGGKCSTRFNSWATYATLSVKVLPAQGDLQVAPAQRTYRILFRGVNRPEILTALLNTQPVDLPSIYEESTRTFIVGPVTVDIKQGLSIDISALNSSLVAQPSKIENLVLRLLHRARMETNTKWKINSMMDKLTKDISLLNDPELVLKPGHLPALVEILTDQPFENSALRNNTSGKQAHRPNKRKPTKKLI